jgi:hypothetical protein
VTGALAAHLLVVGGISQLVIAASQHFARTALAVAPPSRAMVRAQLATWNAGTLLVAVGLPVGAPGLTAAGAMLLLAGLALYAAALTGMRRRSERQLPWAVLWYQASAAWLALGMVAGVLRAYHAGWPPGNLAGAHAALVLGGWLGTAIIGTLHRLVPVLTGARLRHPRLQAPTFALWAIAIAELAAGSAFDVRALVAAGWTDALVALALLAVDALAAAPRSAVLPVRLVALGQAFLGSGLLVGLLATLSDGTRGPFAGPGRDVLTPLLGAWIGLTIAGALTHLLGPRMHRPHRPAGGLRLRRIGQ